MTEQFISEVQRRMLPYLNNAQLLQLKTALTAALQGATICYEEDAPAPSEQKATDAFLSAKRIEGCSEKTLGYYHKTIETMLSGSAKQRSRSQRKICASI